MEIKKENLKKHFKGLIYINKDNINKRVREENLEKYLEEGWKKGRINHNSIKGKIRIEKDGILKFINKEDLESMEKNGWKKDHSFICEKK